MPKSRDDEAYRKHWNLATRMGKDDYESKYFFPLHFDFSVYMIYSIGWMINECFSNKYTQRKCHSSGIVPSYLAALQKTSLSR